MSLGYNVFHLFYVGADMKLKPYKSSLEEKMSEFDIWVTPSLGDIRDVPQFQSGLNILKNGLDILADVTENFEDYHNCCASSLASCLIAYIAGKEDTLAKAALSSVANVLLLATGKTDNNLKCQFPLLLRNQYKVFRYPVKNAHGLWRFKDLPRTLTLEDAVKIIVTLSEQVEYQKIFAESYFHLIISDELYAKQIWCLGNVYVDQNRKGCADFLLTSMAIFQSRGSVTATTGHLPEHILRDYMTEWGMEAGRDFNLQDVEISDLLKGIDVSRWAKKRKYDFVIPFQSRKEGKKIFIQSQFYAGDSGSVSHKVVDQTDSTREATLRNYPDAIFVEYLDGAGYFSSLNGDLRKMLAKPTTKEFIQIRTAPIKLRRELQEIHFLTLLEVEHAVVCTDGEYNSICSILTCDGYPQEEIDRVLSYSLNKQLLLRSPSGQLKVSPFRLEIVRRYCLLDFIANYGRKVSDTEKGGILTVAGYEIIWGLPQADVMRIALETIPNLDFLWDSKLSPFRDIQWLLDHGFVEIR